MRADRLLGLLLILQARGRTTARALATELEVCVRTIYRDLEALGAAGVPIRAESGPGGGCELLPGYRSPLAGLSRQEAAALLILGVPEPLRELGLDATLNAAHRRVRSVGQLPATASTARVHLDMPRWFRSRERVPCLAVVADAVQRNRRIVITYERGPTSRPSRRTIEPLGLVNKAGIWYVVGATARGRAVFRAGRIRTAAVSEESFDRPADFDLAAYWAAWSEDFEASRPRLAVHLRASPDALAAMPEIFGESVLPKIAAAGAADGKGWRTLTLDFEHAGAACYRLAGFGGLIEVLSPAAVRDQVVATAQEILRIYRGAETNAGR